MKLGLWESPTAENYTAVAMALRRTRARIGNGWRPALSGGPGDSPSGTVVHFWCSRCCRIHEAEASESCPPSDCDATAVCLNDALLEASKGSLEVSSGAEEVLSLLLEPSISLARWEESDGRTHAEVLALLDRAVLRSEAMRRSAVQTFVHAPEKP